MKILVFALASIMSISAFASMNSAQIDQVCLDLLVANAKSIPMEGDVHSNESLAGILANGLKKNQAGQYINKVTQTCHKISYDGIYDCTLIMESQVNGITMGETGVNYILGISKDGVTPENVIGRAIIMRGH